MGTQSQPSADMLLQVVLSSKTAQTTPPDMALLSEGKDSAPPTRVQVPVPPNRRLHKRLDQPQLSGGRQQKQEEL